MTDKLFENDSYINEFEAKVLECAEYKERYKIVLDKTAFFPEGGGQKADTGFLNGVKVIDVWEKDGTVYHEVSEKLEPGTVVKGEIDWLQRFYRMQNHSGEHLISGIIHALYGYNNVGFHMGHDVVTLDVDGRISIGELKDVEERANEAIYENVPIRAFVPDKSELEGMEIRSKIDLVEGIRIVEIEGYDRCACCAPHVAKTGEIGIVKILNSYPNKGGTRIELLCGHDALEYYRKKLSDNTEIMKLLSAPDGQTAEAVRKLLDSISAYKTEIRSLKDKLALAKLKVQKINSVAVGYLEDADFDDLRVCINQLTVGNDGICAVFSGTENTDGCMYIVSSESSDIAKFMQHLKDTLNAKGGGKSNYSQGKVPANFGEIIKAIENYRV